MDDTHQNSGRGESLPPAALADGFLFRSPVAFLRDGFSSPAYLWLSLETLSG
jgi:hypothetical protein